MLENKNMFQTLFENKGQPGSSGGSVEKKHYMACVCVCVCGVCMMKLENKNIIFNRIENNMKPSK